LRQFRRHGYRDRLQSAAIYDVFGAEGNTLEAAERPMAPQNASGCVGRMTVRAARQGCRWPGVGFARVDPPWVGTTDAPTKLVVPANAGTHTPCSRYGRWC
jgi:hypothetical protein